MSDKLKPCPFCGATAHIRNAYCESGKCIWCPHCFAQGPAVIGKRDEYETDAIRAWNRRAN